jgi:hypothetical protein
VSCPPWGTWSLDGTSCSGPSCPLYEPITGSSCAGFPGGTTCDYPPGAACPQPCVCGADGRWTCYTVLCDAGPPPPSPCDDGFPCAPGTGCATPCYKSCACGPDGIYHCTPSPCADAGGI